MVAEMRMRVGRARRNARFAALAGARTTVPYVGWSGEGNLGDEAMLEAHRLLLPRLPFGSIPSQPSARAARLVAAAPWLSCPAVCLGGGTLIGNGTFRQALATVTSAWPGAPRFTLGAGVEDPGYTGGDRADVRLELGRWTEPLERFAFVGVRGPLSQGALHDIGIPARVVGDPALAMPRPDVFPERGLLGVNLGVVDDQWGDDPQALRRAVVEAARLAIAGGWRVRFVSTYAPDAAYQAQIAAELGPMATATPASASLEAVMAELGRCDVLVAHKLHACILAALSGVPCLALEYRPKCRDFQESVGRGEHVVRTDEVVAADVVERVEAMAHDRDVQSAALGRAVDRLRDTLRGAAIEIGSLVSGP